MVVLCTLRACIVKISVRRRMFCKLYPCDMCVISYMCGTRAELWSVVCMCLRGGVTICGPRERPNVHNDISETFQMAL